jgi:hypothetical protein
MRKAALIFAMFGAALLSACQAMLAERPLFSLADQAGPPPLSEGVWGEITSTCTPEILQGDPAAIPEQCALFDIRRNEEGAWVIQRADERGRRENNPAVPFVIAPAVERAVGDEGAPLYVAEIPSMDQPHPERPFYIFFAPLRDRPAMEIYAASIDCPDALRDGPIDGVASADSELGQRLGTCVATSQAGVREAARRAAIEHLPDLDQKRMIYLRP